MRFVCPLSVQTVVHVSRWALGRFNGIQYVFGLLFNNILRCANVEIGQIDMLNKKPWSVRFRHTYKCLETDLDTKDCLLLLTLRHNCMRQSPRRPCEACAQYTVQRRFPALIVLGAGRFAEFLLMITWGAQRGGRGSPARWWFLFVANMASLRYMNSHEISR